MQSKKTEQRKALEQGMMAFLASGKSITKIEHKPQRAKGTKPSQQVVEIEINVSALPTGLREAFFPDEE